MRSYRITVDPKSNDWWPYKAMWRQEKHRKKKDMCRWRHRLKLCCHKARNTKDCQQPPDAWKSKEGLFSRAFRGSTALTIPWFWTSSLQNVSVRKLISVVLNHSVCDNLLWLSWETNTPFHPSFPNPPITYNLNVLYFLQSTLLLLYDLPCHFNC